MIIKKIRSILCKLWHARVENQTCHIQYLFYTQSWQNNWATLKFNYCRHFLNHDDRLTTPKLHREYLLLVAQYIGIQHDHNSWFWHNNRNLKNYIKILSTIYFLLFSRRNLLCAINKYHNVHAVSWQPALHFKRLLIESSCI